MRTVLLLTLIGAACRTQGAFGTWKGTGLIVRFEPHAKGEVFTVDTTGGDGRATSSSTILYLDGKARDFEDLGCSGTQSSRRVDSRTVEILRQCASGEWTRFVRKELVLEITEQRADGRRVEQRSVLEKQ